MRQDQNPNFCGIVGESEPIQEVISEIKTLASRDEIVLITGETGVGKGLVAKALLAMGDRKNKRFIAVNCGTLTPNVPPHSDFFGHEKGAYTGADSQHKGIFEQANGGTLFLDEIGEMDPDIQKTFLQVLDNEPFRRLKGTKDIHVNVRFIAATNIDLAKAFREGKLRNDFYYRVNNFPINIPPLRERREDISLLVYAFISMFSAKSGKTDIGIGKDALDFLETADWPGNVRQLMNVVNRAIVYATTERLELNDVQEAHSRLNRLSEADTPTPPPTDYHTLVSKFVVDLNAYFQNQGSQVDVEDLRHSIEGAILKSTDQYQQLEHSLHTPSTPTQDDTLPSPSLEWVDEFKSLLEPFLKTRSHTTGRDYQPRNIERKIDTFVALIEESDGLKLNHLKKDMPYYRNRQKEKGQYVSVAALRGMYKNIIKPILESKANEGLFEDNDLAEVPDDINNTVIRQLRYLLRRVNPQLQLHKAEDTIKNANATRTPQPTR